MAGGAYLKSRIKNIYNNCKHKPDVILIKNSIEPNIDENFFYVTDLKTGLFEGAAAVLYPSGEIKILVNELEEETAKKADAEIFVYKNEKDFFKQLINEIPSSRTIGINYNKISFKNFLKIEKNFPKSNFVDVSEPFNKTRLVKDTDEIKLIKKGCEIVDKTVEKIPDILYEGIPEFQLAAEINYIMQKNGADKTAFETISSFGTNTAQPHYSHGNNKLRKGDIVLCDFGACFKKYNSDITRCFIYGKANEKQKKMHEIVKTSQKIGFENIRENVKSKEVHKAVEENIDRTEFKGRFIHSTGHSIGLSVHDGQERISNNSDLIFKENMVFTVEPGIYIPEFGGIRIEDDVLIKKDGIEILTKSSKELIEIN